MFVAGIAAAKEEVRWGREEVGNGWLGQTTAGLSTRALLLVGQCETKSGVMVSFTRGKLCQVH